MGKKIIVKGADFSANGFMEPEVLSPTWTDSKALVARDSSQDYGDAKTSTTFKISNKLDVGQHLTLTYTRPNFTTGGGVQSGYGTVFYDSSNNPVGGDEIPKGTGVMVVTINIPENAATVAFTYFMETEVSFSAILE